MSSQPYRFAPEPTTIERLDRFMAELDAGTCKRCGSVGCSCLVELRPEAESAVLDEAWKSAEEHLRARGADPEVLLEQAAENLESRELPPTGRVVGATLRTGDTVESITLDELIDADTKISFHVPEGGDVVAEGDSVHVAQPEPDSTSVSVVATADVRLAVPASTFGPADVLRHFLMNRSESTLRNYGNDLKAFAAWLGVTNRDAALAQLLALDGARANALVLEWLSSMRGKIASSTCSRRVYTIRSLTKIARMLGVITWAIEVSPPKSESYRDTSGPPKDEIQKMYLACTSTRDRAIVLLTYVLGLRRVELCRMNLEHYDREHKRLRILGKNDKIVVDTLPTVAATVLDKLIDEQGITEPTAPLFCNETANERLTTNGIYDIISRIGERAQLKVHPHGIRHSAITRGLDQTGGDVRRVRVFARHAKADTTLIYDDNRKDHAGDIAQMLEDELLEGIV